MEKSVKETSGNIRPTFCWLPARLYTIVEVAVQANQVMGAVVFCSTTKKPPQQI